MGYCGLRQSPLVSCLCDTKRIVIKSCLLHSSSEIGHLSDNILLRSIKVVGRNRPIRASGSAPARIGRQGRYSAAARAGCKSVR
jgi:hypothetical protein